MKKHASLLTICVHINVRSLKDYITFLNFLLTIKLIDSQKHCRKPTRKEVIQAQIPLRLPCYDLAPIINPSLVPNVLREEPTFVTRRAVSTKLENLFTVA